MISEIIGFELVAKFQDPSGIDYIINLVKTGALSINATDTSYGNSLLHFAVGSINNANDFNKFLAFYQENGGNLNARNGQGKTARDLCPKGNAQGGMHWKTQALLTFNAKPASSLRPLLSSTTRINPIRQQKIFTENEAAKALLRQQSVNLDERHQDIAINISNERRGLAECIAEKVLPNLLYIQTRNGTYGTGFFQHNKWIVSNAHVLAFAELLNGAKFYTFSKNAIDIEVSRSFHRPAENPSAPDIVIVNAESSHNNLPSLPMQFSDDKGTSPIYFYIRKNSTLKADNFSKINFLEKLSHPEICPDIYRCVNANPLPGESGSPIFAARVIMARKPSWQICVVGVLYARCSPEEYNNQAKVKIESVASDQILICAIPIAQDFEQILQNFLQEEDMAIRAEQMANLLKEDDPRRAQQMEQARIARAKMVSGLSDFNTGVTNLNINLPAGLTKLLGKTIVPLGRSMLLGEKVAKKWKKEGEIKKEISDLPHPGKNFPDFTLEELETDVELLLSKIPKDEKLEFVPTMANKTIFETKSFRIDQMGASNSNWKLEIQDNTDAFYPRISPSLSCTFAVVLIPKGLIIQGSILAQAFRDSLQEQKSKDYPKQQVLPKQRKGPVFLPAPSVTYRLPNNCCASKRPLNLGEDWNDPDRRFQRLLEERFFQPITPLSKNGHCQFKAIAHELRRLGEFSTVNINQLTENTRRIAIKCMEIPEKRNELILFFNQEECNGCPSYDEYLTQMKNSLNSSVDTVAYGSEITLNAVGNLLWKNKQIAIILMHPNDFFEGAGEAVPLAQRVYGCKDLTKLNLEKTIYLVFDGGNHYDAIEYLSEGLKTYWQGRLINAIANINPPPPAHHHGTALIG